MFLRSKIIFQLAGALVAGFSATAAPAETLRISGLYPANVDGVALIESISIENFGGSDGSALGFALEAQLGSISFDGERYFTIMASRSATDPQAILSGSATAGVDQYNTTEYRSRCVERDEKDKCIKRKSIEVPCEKRVIDFRANIRLARFEDGQTIFTDGPSKKHEQTVCGRDESFSSSESEIRKMIDSVAYELRRDLAPIRLTQKIRVLERRKGMAKAQAKFFKAAVKMTKKGEAEACRMFDNMAAGGAPHGSITFNRALCAEQRGELDTALSLYADADLQLGGNKTSDDTRRVFSHQRALADWDARMAALNPEPESSNPANTGPASPDQAN